jgi:hypothetical protein
VACFDSFLVLFANAHFAFCCRSMRQAASYVSINKPKTFSYSNGSAEKSRDGVTELWTLCARVARWNIYKSKIPIVVNFWRALKWKMWVYFRHIWSTYVLWGH